jgi:hypothetical protein
MFIHESTFTKCPLYVSPDFNSISCKQTGQAQQDAVMLLLWDHRGRVTGTSIWVIKGLTTGCACAVRSSDNGSMVC